MIALELVLLVVELLVPSVSREQLLVCPPFDDLAAFKDQDLIRAADRREPVGDDEGRAPTAQRTQSVLNQRFAFWLTSIRTAPRTRR